jgi:hypothetical protein
MPGTKTKEKSVITTGLGLLVIAGLALGAGPAGAASTRIVSSTSTLAQANETPRKTVLCPKKNPRFKFPYGGSMFSTAADPDGETVYPHSYERLGVQGGYHVTPVLYDPSPAATTARPTTLQVVCGPEPGRLNPPHQTAQVDPGQSKTHLVRCSGKRRLIGGGFQRTDFINRGGNFATESHAVAPNLWQVSGTAFGGFGGELTGIAYCRKKSSLSEVSATVMLDPGKYGSATTPRCTGGKSMVFTGFNTEPKGSIFYAGGPINGNQTTTGSGYNRSLAPALLTVYGYCLRVRAVLGPRK